MYLQLFDYFRASFRPCVRSFGQAGVMVLVLALTLPSSAWAQGAIEPVEDVEAAAQGDSLRLSEPMPSVEPHGWDYLKPVGWMLFTNGMFWGVSRFLLNKHYSYIAPSTIADNFRDGWEWDADAFPTNQFGHPYQGGLYHAGARASGFSFWAAIPYTALGSLQWELFMETERPSYNDLITTTVGGVILGEVLFRLSSLLLDDSTRGSERAIREGGALAISPIYGISRLVSGDATGSGIYPVRAPAAVRFALGFDNFRLEEANQGVRNLGLDARVVYGSFVDEGHSFEPFDWFSVAGGLNFRRSEFQAAQFDITGLLARWGFGCGEGNDCAVGPSMHYDYNRTPVFSVGTSAVGASAFGRFDLGFWSLKLYTELDLQIIALGGFDSPYAEVVERDYNLGAGGFTRATVILTKPDWFQLRIFTSRYYVRTLHGAAGNEFAGIVRSELEIPIYAGFGVSGGNVVYDRTGTPEDYPEVQNTYIAQQLQIFWRSQFGEFL